MIDLKQVSIKYVKEYYSLYNVNLQIEDNSLLVGGETSGNNFLLRLLAKIDTHYDGEIFIDGNNLKKIKDKDLNLAYIPKTPCLFENKSVIENLIYPIKIRKIDKNEAILRAKTAIKPYFLKIFENFSKINDDLNRPNKIKIDSNSIYQTNYSAEQTGEYSKSNNEVNANLIFDANKTNFNHPENDGLKEKNINKNFGNRLESNVLNSEKTKEGVENNFEKFLNTKVKKLDLATKKIITLLRAKIRAPKYILIENFFENLDDCYFDLANEIISSLSPSTIVATQSDEKTIPAYKNFKQIIFDAGSVKKDD